MRNKFIASMLLLSMSMSSISFAQDYNPDPENDFKYASTASNVSLTLPPIPEVPKNEPNVGEAVSPMKRGQTAPFTGLLLSPAAVAKIIADIESKNDEIQLEVEKATAEQSAHHEYEKSIMKIRSESDSKIFTIRIDGQQKEIDRLDAQLKQERESRPNVFAWTALGLGAGVLLSTLTAAVIVSIKNNN